MYSYGNSFDRIYFLVSAERNEIHAKFSESILDMQQKSGLKYMVLEKKITAMRQELDVKDAQMHEIVKASQSSDRGNKLAETFYLFRVTVSFHYDNAFLRNVAGSNHNTAKQKIREIINLARPVFSGSSYKFGHRITLEAVDISHVNAELTLHSNVAPL